MFKQVITKMAGEDVSLSKLGSGVLNALDLASNIPNVINMTEDQNRLKTIMANLGTYRGQILASGQELAKLALKDGYNINKQAYAQLPQVMQFQHQYAQNILMQSATGFRMTASAMNTEAKLKSQLDLTDLYARLVFDLPESYVVEKAKRFYNKLFRIGDLSTEFATKLYNKKKISETLWKDSLANHGIPDNIMGLILDDVEQKPNMGTVMRMYQFLDIPDTYLNYLMTENNITDKTVRALWLNYFHANRLRDEMSQYKLQLHSAYQSGLLTSAQLETQLAQFKASQEEIDQIVVNEETEFQRQLSRIEAETRVWLYRKGVFGEEGAEEELYDELIAVGINSALVNATVRLEAAKKGINWEKQ